MMTIYKRFVKDLSAWIDDDIVKITQNDFDTVWSNWYEIYEEDPLEDWNTFISWCAEYWN